MNFAFIIIIIKIDGREDLISGLLFLFMLFAQRKGHLREFRLIQKGSKLLLLAYLYKLRELKASESKA